MKQAMNFRLSKCATVTLTMLEKKMHASKTSIVEKALEFYAKKKLPQQNQLLGFAGILNEEESDSMLKAIKTRKRNKDIKVEL